MDQEDLSYRKWPYEPEFSARKQFKNPLQIQILEEAYGVNQNPTSRMKEDLARRTGLDFMQVQSWFGNRRYYDRHGPRKYKPMKDDSVPPGVGKSMQVNSEFDHPVSGAGPSLINGPLRASESCVFLNPKPLRSVMPAGTSMAMPLPPTTQSHSFTMYQPHFLVTHAEDGLKRPFEDDTPVFTNFKHLTSRDFQSPLVNMEQRRVLRLAPQSCSLKNIGRAWLDSNKPLTFSGTLECRCSKMPFNETVARVGDVHMLDVERPRAVQEQQFFPQKPNWLLGYQNASHTHVPVSPVDTSHCRGQTSKGCAYASSSFPYQCEMSNAANSSHQADDHNTAIPMPQLGNSPYSIPHENNLCSVEKEKMHLDGSSKFQNFDHVRVSTATTPYQNRNLQERKAVQNQRRYSFNGLHHKRSYDRYIVMPRGGSETSVNGANQVSYFSNADNNFRLIVAKWNSKEGRAVYTEDDSDALSSGTDTTLSDNFHDEVTANVKYHAEGKSPVVINVDAEPEATGNVKNQAKGKFIEIIDIDDEEDDAGEDHNARQSIVVWNGDNDWEMEDAGYKVDKDSRDKNVGINEHIMASPVSSEHTL